jgi:hypothetical protein
MHMVNAALEFRLLILEHAAPGTSLAEQRLALGPWLALTGRCLLAIAQVVHNLQDRQMQALDLKPIRESMIALCCFAERLSSVL